GRRTRRARGRRRAPRGRVPPLRLLRLVLRGALRDERARLADEDAVPQVPVQVDVATGPEEVGHGSGVDDRDDGLAVDVAQAEAKPAGVRVSPNRAEHEPGEL